MPTFDFYNIIRGFLRLILFTVRNPILLLSAVAAILAMMTASIVSEFGFDQYVDSFAGSIADFQRNGFVNTIFYVLNIDAFLSMIAFSFRWVTSVVVFIATFFVAWWGAILTYRAGGALRATIKDIAA